MKQTYISPEKGFKMVILPPGNLYYPEDSTANHLLMVMEGSLQVSCNEFCGRLVDTNKCILLPIGADAKCTALSSCHLIIFVFDTLSAIYKGNYMESLCRVCEETTYTFEPLPLYEPLQNFLHLLNTYFGMQLDGPAMQEIKQREFFLLLQLFYTHEEVALLFYPLIGHHHTFRIEVLRHYGSVKQADELAILLGMEERTFSRRMKEEFGQSPYQWLLRQKAKHVRFSLVETDKPLEAIRKEYGFKFPGHFTRFCKEYLKQTPLRIRNDASDILCRSNFQL